MTESGKDPKETLELIPEHEPQDLVITPPPSNEKGFLKRQNKIVRFMHAFESTERQGVTDPELITNMAEFMLDYITTPADRKEASDLLWELSEDEFKYVMAVIQGVGDDTVPPTKDSP